MKATRSEATSGGVDVENIVLKSSCPGDQARVEPEVDTHVGTDPEPDR